MSAVSREDGNAERVNLLQGLGDQLLGELGRFALRDHPSHDVAAEDVEGDVQVVMPDTA